MATPESEARGASPSNDDEHTFPHFPSSRSDAPGTAHSVVSSRMTDIMSDDGADDGGAGVGGGVASTGNAASRPPTARTGGLASARNSQLLGQPAATHLQPLRRGPSLKRSSIGGTGIGIGSSSSAGGNTAGAARPISAASRSHVPSLTSYAFFHPMSSQKLQAQRGVNTRPRNSQLIQQQQQQPQPQPQLQQQQQQEQAPQGSANDGLAGLPAPYPRPISRGSEFTDLGTIDRLTANTSPAPGHYATASLTDSVRPLHQQRRISANLGDATTGTGDGAKAEGGAGAGAGTDVGGADAGGGKNRGGLSIRVDKSYKSGVVGSLPTPVRTPRSFRSSFVLPGNRNSHHGGGGGTGVNRDIQGGEKLDSVASTPQRSPSATTAHSQTNGDGGHGDSAAAAAGRRKAADAEFGKGGSRPTQTYTGKNYQYFEGNTVFCLGGRFENTKSRPINLATGLLVLIPCVLFFVFSAPWLWHHLSPAIPITFAYVFYICVSSFLHASVSDPGILPRNLHPFPPPDENEDPLQLGPPTTDWALVKTSESSTAAMEVPVKYCRTCNIWRPPRAHHCRMCDNCVETADHHCVWLNNCVGRRNYRYFFTFVSSCTLLALYLAGASLAQVLVYRHRAGVSFGAAIDHFRVPFALFLYGLLACSYPVPLMAYHLFLMARGETTREFLNSHKFPKKDRYRAYTLGGAVLNWVAVLCRPRPPSYYQFKRPHVAGDRRLAAEPTQVTARHARDRRAHNNNTAFSKGDALEMQDVAGQNPGGFQGPVALQSRS
ncbi:dhhc zinc finger membrane protein [Niveomyces insectorum RCEF 264]|uniref:Palmitoyltransferase n=1 Tax=Niveomyces insectorum RCEF 264 TaxID=1081102 RepID=A0A167TFF4_9HYPO|nr:dhhc zinc finger membrane protein [Niveomyces insectorum RCEF 264]